MVAWLNRVVKSKGTVMLESEINASSQELDY